MVPAPLLKINGAQIYGSYLDSGFDSTDLPVFPMPVLHWLPSYSFVACFEIEKYVFSESVLFQGCLVILGELMSASACHFCKKAD